MLISLLTVDRRFVPPTVVGGTGGATLAVGLPGMFLTVYGPPDIRGGRIAAIFLAWGVLVYFQTVQSSPFRRATMEGTQI